MAALDRLLNEPPHPSVPPPRTNEAPQVIETPEISPDPSLQAFRFFSSPPAISDAAFSRKQKLEADSYALEVTQTTVQCGLCHTVVKLSDKSAFDMHHWKIHIARCKKKDKRLREVRSTLSRGTVKRPGTTALVFARPVRSNSSPRTKRNPENIDVPYPFKAGRLVVSASYSDGADRSTHTSINGFISGGGTPPLTPDRQSSEAPSSSASVRQPSPPPPPLVRAASIYSADTPVLSHMGDYAYLSYRSRGSNHNPPAFVSDKWQDWHWNHLQLPGFSTPDSAK